MSPLWFVTACLWFVTACLGWSCYIIERERLASYKRIGTWFEARVAELENENRALAEQVIAAGGVRAAVAMPIPPYDPGYEYAYDPTGLVQEKLDPRDLPVS